LLNVNFQQNPKPTHFRTYVYMNCFLCLSKQFRYTLYRST